MTHIKGKKEERERTHTKKYIKREINTVRIVTKNYYMNKSFLTYFDGNITVFGFLFKIFIVD